MNKNKSGFVTFICACIPGCGEMYLGYMKRGLSICGLFWLFVALSSVSHLNIFMFLLPIIWLYGFFDSFNIRGYDDAQAADNPDAYLFGIDDGGKTRLSGKRGLIIGWILVIIGVYALWSLFSSYIYNYLGGEMYWLYDLIAHKVPDAFIIVLIIGLGVWFIRGPKHKAEDDFKTFAPPSGSPSENQDEGKKEN
jgi:hypothetical protein